MQVRRVRVRIEMPRLRVTGVLQLPTEGYRSRTTDYLNAHETGFIALTEADVQTREGGAGERHPFVAVGSRHIVALVELEDLGVIEEDVVHGLGSVSVPPPAVD